MGMCSTTNHVISDKLRTLSKEHQVSILYAAESGSRAWGMASTDSDYDIRFIYAKPSLSYLGIHSGHDTIEKMDGDLDFSGWDIRKAFSLMEKGNVAPLEWLASGTVYYDHNDEDWVYAARKLMRWDRAIVHYYGLAKRMYAESMADQTEWPLKKVMYVLRSTMMAACMAYQLVDDADSNPVLPPLDFTDISRLFFDNLQHHSVTQSIADSIAVATCQPTISHWLTLKRSGDESMVIPADDNIRILVVNWMEWAKMVASAHTSHLEDYYRDMVDRHLHYTILHHDFYPE